MKTKFEQGEKVSIDGKEAVIEVAKKDFSTKQIHYKLTDGRMVTEDKIKRLKGGKPVDPNAELFAEYKKLFGKEVPANKKNKIDWIQTKVDAKKAEIAAKEQEGDDTSTYDALKALNEDQLKALITEKDLDIDPEDYESPEDLLVAVCEELDIEIPTEDDDEE